MSQPALQHFRSCIPMFQVLTDPHRQDILLLLSRHTALSVSDIARESVLSRPAVSHHLKLLLAQGLVSVEKRGTERFYTLTLQDAVQQLKQLTALLERDCIAPGRQTPMEGATL